MSERPEIRRTIDLPSQEELVRRAIASQRPNSRHALWVRVMDTFCMGSTYSRALCIQYGFDPDARSVAEMRVTARGGEGEGNG